MLIGFAGLTFTAVPSGASPVEIPAVLPPCTNPISNCCQISGPGTYYLGSNIFAPPLTANEGCLDVNSPNVTIDLYGYSLTGNGSGIGTGIFLHPSAAAAIVYNPGWALTSDISDFGSGITDEAVDTMIRGSNIELDNNLGTGISLLDAPGATVENGAMSGNGHFGIYLQSTVYDTIYGNSVARNGIYGIWLQGASFNSVSHNAITSNTTAGIFLGCANNGNTNPTLAGCSYSDWNVISDNTLVTNGYGIAVSVMNEDNYLDGNHGSGDSPYDLFDANAGCGPTAATQNVWIDNVGTRNQMVSSTCIG